MENEIRKKLFELSDEKYKNFHGSLCPGVDNIIGVRVPVLRNYAKELAKQDWKANLKLIADDYYEEVMLQGLIIGYGIKDIAEFQDYLEKFVPKINNWAVCDVCSSTFKITKKYKEEIWQFLEKYLNSNEEFYIRFGVVMLLDYYILPEYISRVLEILDSINHDGYYVKMAVAWAVSVCYIKFPNETKKYLKNCNLDEFTFKKSIQKIRDSYRVSKEEKDKLLNITKI